MSRRLATATLGLLVFVTSAVAAHGGGLNAEGCHNDRKNSGYHCHRAPAARALAADSIAPEQAQRNNAAPAHGGAAYYRSCSDARAAGAAPMKRGDQGYGSHLDRDNDGVGCE